MTQIIFAIFECFIKWENLERMQIIQFLFLSIFIILITYYLTYLKPPKKNNKINKNILD